MLLLSNSFCPPSILQSPEEPSSFLIATVSAQDDHSFDLYKLQWNKPEKAFITLYRNLKDNFTENKNAFITTFCLYSNSSCSTKNVRLLMGTSSGYLSHWDNVLHRPTVVSIFNLSSQPITALAVDRKFKVAVAGGFGSNLYIFELNPKDFNQPPMTFTIPLETEGSSSIAFRDDNKKFAVAGFDHKIRIFSRNGKLLSILDVGSSTINWIEFSPSIMDHPPTRETQPTWHVPVTNLIAAATQDSIVYLWRT